MIKFTITRLELARALEAISAAAGEEDKAVAVNNQVRIVGEDHQRPFVTIQARGSLCTISLPVIASFDEPFECCIEYRQLVKLVKMLNDDIVFAVESGWARIKSGSSRFRVPSSDPAMFPAVTGQIGDPLNYIGVGGADFLRMIKSSYIAVAKEDSAQFALRGIQMRYKSGKLQMAGCDGHEACRSVINGNSPSRCPDFDVVIPQLAAPSMIRLVKKESDVMIYGGLKAEIVVDDIVCQFTLLAGTYPDVGRLILDHHAYSVELVRSEIMKVLNKAQTFSDPMNPRKLVAFVWQAEKLTVMAMSPLAGSFSDELPLGGSAGIVEPIVMTLSSTQILAALGAFSEERAVFSFTSSTQQLQISPVGCAFEVEYVTMPHRGYDISAIDLTENSYWETN